MQSTSVTNNTRRNVFQMVMDTLTFPVRAICLYERDAFGLSSLQTERYDYVVREVKGYCLDIGCGRNDRFNHEFLGGRGVGIDVYQYEGLKKSDIVKDMTNLPYATATFDTVTLIANINHIPKSIRVKELKEIHRVLKQDGQLIVTMGNPLAETLTHKIVHLFDKLFKTTYDVDTLRGMDEEESYFLTDAEIRKLLSESGYTLAKRKYFLTQWGLNKLYIGKKDR